MDSARRRAIVFRICETGVSVEDSTAPSPAAGAGTKASMSRLTMRPPSPVPVTRPRSMLRSAANRAANGEALTFPLEEGRGTAGAATGAATGAAF